MSAALIRSLYTREEVAVLDEFFGVSTAGGEDEHGDTLCASEALETLGYSDARIPAEYSECAPAAAEIALRSLADRLPNWGGMYVGRNRHRLVPATTSAEQREQLRLALIPRFLFSINWADSGPGFSWPMGYHLTWLPGYDRYVVTSSSDSSEGNFGYCDLALDWIDGALSEAEVIEAAGNIVAGDWYWQFAEWEQPRWTAFLSAGLISAATADELATALWDPPPEDEEDFCDDDGEEEHEEFAESATGSVAHKEAR